MKKLLVVPLASAFFSEDLQNCMTGYQMGVLLKEEQDFYSLPSVYKKLKEYDNSLKVCDSGQPVSQTFVINLDRATDRLARVKEQMAHLKLPFMRIQGVDGLSIEKYWNEGNAEAARGIVGDSRIKWDPMTHKRGFREAACGVSHLRTMLRAKDRIEQGEALDGPVFVLEDDIELSQDLSKDLRENITWLNQKYPNWKLFVIGHCYRELVDKPTIDKVHEVEDATCAHAYILNGLKAIDMLLDTVNIVEFTEPFDFMWTEAMYKKNKKGFDTFAYLPNDLAVQNRSLASSVSPGNGGAWKPPKNPIP